MASLKLWAGVFAVVAASSWWLVRSMGSSPLPLSVDRPNQPPVQLFAEDDPALLEASTHARDTVDEFLAALARNRREQRPYQAQLKVRIEDSGVVEHVWLVDLRYEAGMIYGSVGNEPLELEHWQLGDAAMVDPREITDWLLIDEGGFHGGFTLRAALEHMPPEQRKRFDQDFVTHFGVAPEGEADAP